MSAITQLWPDGPESPDQALLFAAVQNSPASLAVVDSWIVLYANSAWEEMFEPAGRLGARGRSVEDFIPGQIFQTLLVGQSDRGKTRSLQFPHLRPDGSRVQLEMACANFRMKGRELQVVSASQAGQPKSNEIEMAKAANLESVGRLTGGVAHDFNNLLTGIILYCDLLIAELEKDSRSRHHAREIRKAGEQGARLVRQLLAMARPQAAEHREFALNEVVIGLQELLTRLIGENIVLITSLDADLGTVRMDPVHLQQVLLNLVLNARDAMPDGGEITIATRNCIDYVKQEGQDDGKPNHGKQEGQADREGKPGLVRCVELTVSDTGYGMDAKTLGRAFEPFFTTKSTGRGNGLGLATAYGLAKLEGGRILAESQPGAGTRISLLLPRVDQDAAFDSLPPNSSSSAPSSSTNSKPSRENNEVIHHDHSDS
jgi:signal transduction histidine kinase